MYKKYFATANQIGKLEYNLKAGFTYVVEQTNYGTLVYDVYGNYICESRTDAFDDYREITT